MPDVRDSTRIDAISGAIAGIASSIVVAPLDLIRTRLQAQQRFKLEYINEQKLPRQKNYTGVRDATVSIWRDEGLRGFYRGLGSLMLGYVPSWGIYFTTYDFCKKQLLPVTNYDFIAHILSATSAAVCSTIATNPIWVVKTRLMTQHHDLKSAIYKGTFDCMRQIYKNEGPRAFYRGLAPSLLGVSHVAVQFPLYEKFKVLLEPRENAPDLFILTILMSSIMSKMIATSLTYPHEILRTRLQKIRSDSSSARVSQKLGTMIRDTWHQEGIAAFYQGIGISILRTIPATAVTFVTYETVKKLLSKDH